jgi:tetratricopeptide (TPR) repeat protein
MRRILALAAVLVLAPAALAAPGADRLALIQGNHWKRLRALAEPQLRANPGDAEAAYEVAYTRVAFGDFDGAVEIARKAVALDGSNADAHYVLARGLGEKASRAGILKGMGLAKEFRRENEAALKLAPDHLDALEAEMEFFWQAPGIAGGDKKKAREIASRIGGIDPARGALAEAELEEREKHPDRARIESLFRKAVAARPGDYPAHLALASWCAADSTRHDEAEKLARETAALDPGRAAAYSVMTVLDARRENWSALDADLELAAKSVPDDPSPRYQAARILMTSGKDLPRVERYFREYLTQEPEGQTPPLAAAHWRLGLTLEKEGRKPEAVAEIDSALALEPDFEPAKKDRKRLK